MIWSPAAIATRANNDRIRRLRGLYAIALNLLGHERSTSTRLAVDRALKLLNAQPETDRRREDAEALRGGVGYYKGFGKKRKFVPWSTAE